VKTQARLAFALLLTVTWGVSADSSELHHRLLVRLQPASHAVEVVDQLDLSGVIAPDGNGAYRFVLHEQLHPELRSPGWRLDKLSDPAVVELVGINMMSESGRATVPLCGWQLTPEIDQPGQVLIAYDGQINHPLVTQGEEYQRSFSETAGLIDERGVYLAGASFWVPTFDDGLVTFELAVSGLDDSWGVVSQGRRSKQPAGADGTLTTVWTCSTPTEEVYLVAGPWHEYADRAGEVELLALLRQPDPALAGRYLAASKRYLKLYENMLPPYPYPSFALVENFWETGYGMPGFTLLGPQVIRFPWILTSSYPHELLHNWWGNSVYVDLSQGNWCEGLTAYLADHLFAEQRGEAELHRRSTLKKYTDFVSENRDLPLAEFRSRRSAATEAVGYGKSMMLFHMIRRAIGDQMFLQALSNFFEAHRFTRATFADLATALGETAGGEWIEFINGWTQRTGAPRIEIGSLEVVQSAHDAEHPWQLKLTLEQTDTDEPFAITLPVAVTVEGRDEAILAAVGACGTSHTCEVMVPCPARPLRLDVDPYFDAMRRLDPMEVPPALSTVLGAEAPLFVLPSQAPADEQAAWQELATAWARPEPPQIVLDSELSSFPDRPAWLLGWSNRFAEEVVSRLAAHGVSRSHASVTVAEETLPTVDHSLVLVARTDDPATAVAWISAEPVAAIAGLARKLPHYSRYSFLGFRGSEPENMAKGMWQPLDSPLVRNLTDGELVPLRLPQRRPLAELPAVYDAEALRQTVVNLSTEEMEGRGLGSAGLERATALVEERFKQIGLQPGIGDSFRQTWTWHGGEPARELQLSNLVAQIPGADARLREQPVLLMAHLDHLGRGWSDVRTDNLGKLHPGADDNASGVAVLLELARALAEEPQRPRPVILAVTTGEEAGRLGSIHLLDSLPASYQPFACVTLDTVGRLADTGKLYVLNADSARELRFVFMGVGYTTGAPITIVSEPLDASDQASCLEAGIPGVQLFTGPHTDYHRPSDTADKVDAEGLALVTEAAHEAVAYLAERIEPLTVNLTTAPDTAAEQPPKPTRGSARRASLGTMPDFGYQGPGIRVQQVMPGSGAETAGVQAGDVILQVAGQEVKDLRGLSQVLSSLAPGDTVEVKLLRSQEELTVTATLGSR
jgi:hypothetical protein